MACCLTDCSAFNNELPFVCDWPPWECRVQPPPLYSATTGRGEQRIEFTPHLNEPSSSDSYIQTSGSVVVSLQNQDPAPSIPSYGHRGHIRGVVHCRQPERVQQVSIKVIGKKQASAFDTGIFWSRAFVLWNRTSTEQICPSLHPFSYQLPSRYTTGESQHQLPPSYKVPWAPGFPVDFVNIKYSIIAFVTYSKPAYKFSGDMTAVDIPFDYIPRTRAETPILRTPCFFVSIKQSPELWTQGASLLLPQAVSDLKPINSLIFLPNCGMFSLRDPIPFHIQLNGPLSSLREFIRPGLDSSDALDKLTNSQKLPKKAALECYSVFSVTLVRKTIVTHPRETINKQTVLGEGWVCEIPPDMCPFEPDVDDEGRMHLNCKGAIRANDGVQVGSFSIMNITVQDSIVLKVAPPSSPERPSPFLPTEITMPITLVTDPYVEAPDYSLANLGL